MAYVGFIALILALITSIYSVIAFVLGDAKGYTRLRASARKVILAVFGLVSLAIYALYYALLSHDFQLEYVYLHTSRDMPLLYNISALWAGNAGSLLFMAWLLSLAAIVIMIRKRGEDARLSAYTYAVIMGTLVFFLLLMILTANPFEKISPVPPHGLGLNPSLENIGMVLHPPLLLTGYIVFTIPFAMAMAALITKNEDSYWLPRARTWALLAWLLLGVGNLIGAWWAYVELDWGGYWAWDPVENAGLMPWLVGTALLHSMSMLRNTRMLKLWTMMLIILSFNLCIFGMFLTRSDFLKSKHNFADTGMEILFIVFLAITLIGPLILVLSRRSYFKGEKREVSLISKENSFVLTNILFLTATFVILLGTVLPWLLEKIAGSIITLETSFFDKAVGPIFLLIILLAGICVLLGWRSTSFLKLIRKAIYPMVISLVLCLVLYLVGISEWYALTLFPLCSFIIFTHLFSVYGDVKNRSRVTKKNLLKAFTHLFWANRPLYGGMIVHLGIALIAIGIIGSSFYNIENLTVLKPDQSTTINNYTITYQEFSLNEASSLLSATISIYDGNNLIGEKKLRTRVYYFINDSGSIVRNVDAETVISPMPCKWFPIKDLYMVMEDWDDWTADGTAIFNIQINPLVSLIWVGGGVLTLGGLFAFWPSRDRKRGRLEDKHKREEIGTEIDRETITDNTSDIPPELNIDTTSEGEETG